MVRTFLRYPGGKDRAVTLSYDDGVRQDMRFIELLRQYGMKCTFNLNSERFVTRDHYYPEEKIWKAMVDEDVVPTYTSDVCSVACHSAYHPTLTHMTAAEIGEQLLCDRKNLEKLFNHPVTGLAIPNGPFDETTLKVIKLCGMTYARAVQPSNSIEFPWQTIPLYPTCSHKSEKLFELADKFLHENPKGDAFLFYVWGHTYNFDEDRNWDVIEKFFETVSGDDRVWYATNDEIFGYASKFKCLEFSADGHTVENPTDTDIWFYSGETHCVKSGETLTF